MPRDLSCAVGDERVTARVFATGAGDGAARLILGHGAGSDQRHPLMVQLAEGLAARGVEVVTFNFLYTEARRKLPDRAPALEACWRAVIDSFRDARRLFIGGKSMGGRIASQVAAAGVDGVAGLVFLGYPLHPPKKPEQLRDAHLPRIAQPMLFVQGERDPFGTPDELRPILTRLPTAELYAVARGDHSLMVPRRATPGQAEVDAAVQQKIVDWIRI